MQFTPQQLNEVLTIIHTNQAVLTGQQFGLEFLSEYDKSLLEANGIDWENLYSEEFDSIYQSFHFGMLSQALSDTKSLKQFTYPELKKYIQGGKYIPVTEREKREVDYIKSQTLSDIRTLNGRIFQDLNGVLVNQSLQSQREFLKKEIEEGIIEKKTIKAIANQIAEKTGDWNRDFDRIVEFQANSAYQEGRAAFISKNSESEDPEVYKLPQPKSACKHCVKHYMTEGLDSEPRIFKLSELKANGTNIGRKVDDWKAVLGSMHPFCRCTLFSKPKGFKWNSSTRSYDIPDKTTPILKKERKPIRVTISGKELLV